MSIINRIVELLKIKGSSQADLCNYIGIKYNVFTTWKTRETDPPAKYLVQICEFLNITLEYLLTGSESSTINKLTQNECEMFEVFRNFNDREQVKIIGRMEEWLETKRQREAISKSQRIVGVQVARRTDGRFVKEPVTAEEMEKIKALPEDTDY